MPAVWSVIGALIYALLLAAMLAGLADILRSVGLG